MVVQNFLTRYRTVCCMTRTIVCNFELRMGMKKINYESGEIACQRCHPVLCWTTRSWFFHVFTTRAIKTFSTGASLLEEVPVVSSTTRSYAFVFIMYVGKRLNSLFCTEKSYFAVFSAYCVTVVMIVLEQAHPTDEETNMNVFAFDTRLRESISKGVFSFSRRRGLFCTWCWG